MIKASETSVLLSKTKLVSESQCSSSNQEARPGVSRQPVTGNNEGTGKRSPCRPERHHPARQGGSEVLRQREEVTRSRTNKRNTSEKHVELRMMPTPAFSHQSGFFPDPDAQSVLLQRERFRFMGITCLIVSRYLQVLLPSALRLHQRSRMESHAGPSER